MGSVSEYIFTVVCAAILCAVLTGISGEKGLACRIRKLICGVFLSLTVIAPLGKIQLTDLLEPIGDIRQDALATASMGQTLYQESLTQVITDRTEAYILDKAQSLGCELKVTVYPDEKGNPYRIILEGNPTESGREALSETLEQQLGIPKERQIWKKS